MEQSKRRAIVEIVTPISTYEWDAIKSAIEAVLKIHIAGECVIITDEENDLQ